MNIRFDGKKALVTGAGKGIGRELAKALVKCGAETYALSRTSADLDSLKSEVPMVHCVCVDLADWQAARQAVLALGPIDLLINNAAVTKVEPCLQVAPETFDWLMGINVKAAINISQVVAENMIERKCGGAIVNVSSQASSAALKDHLMYCSAKAALDATTRVMALEFAQHQIRVNSVNPTVVMTDMGRVAWSDPVVAAPMLARIPLGRFAEVDDVVSGILFLLSAQASMITGVCLPIDGGFQAA